MFITQVSDIALFKFTEQCNAVKSANSFTKPFFELIDFWSNKGYTPTNQIVETKVIKPNSQLSQDNPNSAN